MTAPVMLFFGMQLRVVQVTDASNQHSFSCYLAARIATMTAAVLTVLVTAIAAGHGASVVAVVAAVALMKGVDGLCDITRGVMQKSERMDLFASSQVCQSLLLLAALTGITLVTGALVPALVIVSTGWLTLWVVRDIPRAKRLLDSSQANLWSRCFTRQGWQGRRSLLQAALPLGVSSMLTSLRVTVPTYLLAAEHGYAAVGFFTAVSYVPIAGMAFVEAMGQAVLPRLSLLYVTNVALFRGLLVRLVAVTAATGAAAVVICLVVGDHLLVALYGREFGTYDKVLSVVMIATALTYVNSILGVGMAMGAAVTGVIAGVVWLVCNCGVLVLILRHAAEATTHASDVASPGNESDAVQQPSSSTCRTREEEGRVLNQEPLRGSTH